MKKPTERAALRRLVDTLVALALAQAGVLSGVATDKRPLSASDRRLLQRISRETTETVIELTTRTR